MIDSVLDGTHPRSAHWELIAAGTVSAVEPINGDYGTWGALIEFDVSYWLRGGPGTTVAFRDAPAGSAGVGFDVGRQYLVLLYRSRDGQLETGLCDLNYELGDVERVRRLAETYGALIPSTAMPQPSDDFRGIAGALLLLIGAGLGLRARRRASA